MYDKTTDGRKLKLLTLADNYTRECLAIEVVEVLRLAMAEQGYPTSSGPTTVRSSLRGPFDLARVTGCENHVNHPGSPWKNPFIEIFNGKLWDESLNRELFTRLLEAEVVLNEPCTGLQHSPTARRGWLLDAQEIRDQKHPAGKSLRFRLLVRGGAPAQTATIERNCVQLIDR